MSCPQLSPSPRPLFVVISDSSTVILGGMWLFIPHMYLFFSWTKLTERFFKNTPWPEAEAIAPQVGNGESSTFPWVLRERSNWIPPDPELAGAQSCCCLSQSPLFTLAAPSADAWQEVRPEQSVFLCLLSLLWQEAFRPYGLLMSSSVVFSRCSFPDPIQGAVLQAHLRQSQRECWPSVFLWVSCWLLCASELDKCCCHYSISGPLIFARQNWAGSWALSHIDFREA